MPQEKTKKVAQEIQNLSPSAIIEMFVLEIGASENEWVYFHAGTNQLSKDIVWQGQKYMALPIEASGFDISSQGTLPRPKLTIENIQGMFSALIRQYDDLIGARLIRKRTFAKYMDAVNFPDGNPTADPNVSFPDDIWYIDKKEQETKYSIQWELASAFDLQGVQLPRRQIIQNYCQWIYRSAECTYDGPYYDINDKPCWNKKDDKCAKKLSSCQVRFTAINNGTEKPILPFGGFPGATRNNG